MLKLYSFTTKIGTIKLYVINFWNLKSLSCIFQFSTFFIVNKSDPVKMRGWITFFGAKWPGGGGWWSTPKKKTQKTERGRAQHSNKKRFKWKGLISKILWRKTRVTFKTQNRCYSRTLRCLYWAGLKSRTTRHPFILHQNLDSESRTHFSS